MNKATISGKAWEPETRYSQSGTCITQVSVSVYDGKDQDGKNQYFSITVKAFKELAEQVGNSIVKGDNVIAAGRLKLEKWDSQDGQKHSRMVLIAESIGKDIRFGSSKPAQEAANPFGGQVFPEEEIPF